jgi:hypothetical protein
MVRLRPLLWGAALAGVWLLTSSDTLPDRYQSWTPYFMERAELEKSVFWTVTPREMVDPGKLAIDDRYIYVVERFRGVHIIDNADPANPVTTGFLVAPGCMDVAVKDGVIYVDNAVDLVAYDLQARVETKRLRGYFTEPVSPAGDRYYNSSPDKILVGWKRMSKQEEGHR